MNVKRVNKVKKIFREYMTWIQNSVFEGQLTKSEKKELTSRLEKIIDKDEDSVVFYSIRSEKYMDKEMIGKEKTSMGKVI